MSSTSTNPRGSISPWLKRAAGPILLLFVGCILLAKTWGTWCDVLVDFGVQLYVPWQLLSGKVLYRDIAHYTGPLSVYYNALAMKLLGVSLRAVMLANLPILITIVTLIYALANRLAGRCCATFSGLAVLTLFAFAHVTYYGNYNYVCPYEYDYTHGLVLSLLTVWAIDRVLRGRGWGWAAVAGAAAGLVFLTRSEFFLAVMTTSIVGFIVIKKIRPTFAFLICLPIPLLIATTLLARQMPFAAALRGCLGMWPALLHGSVTSLRFYRHSMGTDHPLTSLALLLRWTGIYLAIIGVFSMLAFLPGKTRGQAWAGWAAALLGILLATFRATGDGSHPWPLEMFRPLPLVAALVMVGAAFILWKHRRGSPPPRPSPGVPPEGEVSLALVFATLCLTLLPKIFFYARIIHYGWTLAMPATVLLVILTIGWLPHWLALRGGSRRLVRGGMAGLWLGVIGVYLYFSMGSIQHLTIPVGDGGDGFYGGYPEIRASGVNRAVDIARQLPPGATLACLPEGITINYLARRPSSLPYVNFNPPDLALFGEDHMLAAMENHPPDFLMIVDKDTQEEFGATFGDAAYGRQLKTWISANYRAIALNPPIGAMPLKGQGFGIRLLAHAPPPASR